MNRLKPQINPNSDRNKGIVEYINYYEMSKELIKELANPIFLNDPLQYLNELEVKFKVL